MATSNDGTVTGRPDQGWRFVVEIPSRDNPNGDPNGKWVYIQAYDSQDEAVRDAKSVTGPVRVRSYAVQHMPQDHGITHNVFTNKRSNATEVELVEFECLTCEGEKAKALRTANNPRCPTCKNRMMTAAFAAAVRKGVREL